MGGRASLAAGQMERFTAWQGGRLMPPLKMYISPTGRCNLRCSYCVHSQPAHRSEHYGSDMGAGGLLRLLREGLGMGIRWFNVVGGGEPFLEKELALEMMRIIRGEGADGAITTNAFLVDDIALRAMVELQWNNLVLSLDSHAQATADSLRAKGAYRHCVRALRRLDALKREAGSALPCVELNPVVTSENYTHVEGILRLAAKHRVGKVAFTPVTLHEGSDPRLRLSEGQARDFQSLARAAIPLSERLGVVTNLPSLLDCRLVTETGNMVSLMEAEAPGHDAKNGTPETSIGDMFRRAFCRFLSLAGNAPGAEEPPLGTRRGRHASPPLCFEPWDSIVILPSGYVNPCQVSNKVSHAGGRSLLEIWQHDPYLESVRGMHAARSLPDFCRKCCSAVVAERLAAHRGMTADTPASEVSGR